MRWRSRGDKALHRSSRDINREYGLPISIVASVSRCGRHPRARRSSQTPVTRDNAGARLRCLTAGDRLHSCRKLRGEPASRVCLRRTVSSPSGRIRKVDCFFLDCLDNGQFHLRSSAIAHKMTAGMRTPGPEALPAGAHISSTIILAHWAGLSSATNVELYADNRCRCILVLI
jgi:hypothetical protein